MMCRRWGMVALTAAVAAALGSAPGGAQTFPPGITPPSTPKQFRFTVPVFVQGTASQTDNANATVSCGNRPPIQGRYASGGTVHFASEKPAKVSFFRVGKRVTAIAAESFTVPGTVTGDSWANARVCGLGSSNYNGPPCSNPIKIAVTLQFDGRKLKVH